MPFYCTQSVNSHMDMHPASPIAVIKQLAALLPFQLFNTAFIDPLYSTCIAYNVALYTFIYI